MKQSQTETIMPVGERGGIGRSFAWLTWSGIVSIANSVLVWVAIARMRNVDELGQFTVVMGLYALFFSIVSLGLMSYVVNEISRRRRAKAGPEADVSEFVSSASVFFLISGLATALVMTACGFLVGQSWPVGGAALALSLALVPTGLIMLSEATAISYGRARLVAAVTTVENLLRTIIPLGLIWGGYDIQTICLSFALVRFVALLAYVTAARSHFELFSFSISQFRKIASVCPTYAGTTVFASINWQAALIILSYLSTEIETAKFGAASRFLIPVTILMSSYANAIQPGMARSLEQSRQELGSYLFKIARLPLIAASVVAIGTPLVSGTILTALFGEEYRHAAQTLEILALIIGPFCLVIVAARGLVAVNSPRIDLFANIVGVVICVISGVILIPRYGAAGAATAQLLSFGSMAVIEVAFLSRKVAGFRVWQTSAS